jgi:hypothetical protein
MEFIHKNCFWVAVFLAGEGSPKTAHGVEERS